MLIDDFKAYSEPCFRDCPPPCVTACPLGLDVKAVIDKVQRKNFTAAFRLYRNQVLFPVIVSHLCPEPCLNQCVRKNTDQAVFTRKIEAACVAYSKDSKPIAFNVPAKPFTVAVVGAGLNGLSCALKLASRNYSVKIYEKSGHWGGRLHGLLLDDLFLADIDNQFSAVKYEAEFNRPVSDLAEIEADAVYVATGSGGPDFGLRDQLNRQSLGTSRPGVFLGGGLLGAESMESIAQGILASYSIEKFLKVGAMDGIPETQVRPTLNKNFYLLPLTPVDPQPAAGNDFTPEEAVAEAERCIRCTCSICRDNCEMMRCYKTVPPKMTDDAIASISSKESITSRVGMKMVNACSQCGLCKKVCPEEVDMETCLLEARRVMHQEEVMPPVYHDFWLRDMNFSCHEAYYSYRPQPEAAVDYLFFPGCQLGASDPDYVLKTYDFLTQIHPQTSLIKSCCGVPADWAGNEALRDSALERIKKDWKAQGRPTLVLACPTCKKTFERYFHEARTVSLYELLANAQNSLPPAKLESATVSVYDPCSSREDPSMRKSVRRLVRSLGLQIEEIYDSGESTRCCGFGGHIQAVRASLVDDIVDRRIKASENEYITYCTNCRDLFAVSGKPSRHILDVLFTQNPADRQPPSLGQRRANRLALKYVLADKAGVGLEPLRKEDEMNLIIPEELSAKMDRVLILEEEVKAVIKHCESTGNKLYDSKSELYMGHLKIGYITYWVSYSLEGDAVRLSNAYSHRMTIEEENVGNGAAHAG